MITRIIVSLFSTLVVACMLFNIFQVNAMSTTDDDNKTIHNNNKKIEAIDDYIEDEIHKLNIPGLALALMKNGEPVFLKGYGISNREKDPVTPQTPFILGSTSKSFTALSTLQLAEQGHINLDAPITDYLPKFPQERIEHSEHITVRHLLNQTSGFSNADGIKDLGDKEDYTLEERFLRHKNVQLSTYPGQTFQYSNLNYILLGWIIETVANQSLNEYIKTNVFEPLNMTNSFTNYEEAKANGLAEGYRIWFGKPIYKPTNYLHHDIASGYVISTAEDMLKYLTAHYHTLKLEPRSHVITQYSTSQLFKPAAQDGHSYKAYGMGWYINARTDDKDHRGDLEHFHSAMGLINVNGTDQWGVVMLVNSNAALTQAPILYALFDNIVSIIKEQSYEPLGKDFQRSQLIFNALLIIIISLTLSQFWVDDKLRKRAYQNKYSYLRSILVPLILKLLVIVVIVFLLPLVLSAPFSVIMLFQPDFGSTLMFTALLTFIAVLIHLFYLKRNK